MNTGAYLVVAALTVACASLLVLVVRAHSQLRGLRERFAPVLDVEAERDRLNRECEETRGALAAERARAEQERAQLSAEIQAQRKRWEKEFSTTVAELETISKQLDHASDQLEMQSFGLYEPLYDFDTSEKYKEQLDHVRARQKEMVRAKTAAVCKTSWHVDGSVVKGRQMTDRVLKMQLRAFNGEADAAISRVKFNNVEKIDERMRKAFDAINKLGESNRCEITREYLDLKIAELHLAHEYAEKKQAEKEEQQRIREQMREEEQARRELQRAQEEAEREEKRYEDALEKARRELAAAGDKKRDQLAKKVSELEKRLAEAHANRERAVSRAQLTKSGHVYIVSNEGSFGKHVYKIGMTRRLDPLDRVKELSDASVPFVFDVHAMIYSEDAPELEARLHQVFDHRRVNLVNNRKEFFHVRLDEIEEVVRSAHGEVEFVRTAIAEEFRKTLAVRAEREAADAAKQKMAEDAAVDAAKKKFESLRAGWYADPVAAS